MNGVYSNALIFQFISKIPIAVAENDSEKQQSERLGGLHLELMGDGPFLNL